MLINRLWQKMALTLVAVAVVVTLVALLAVNLSYEKRFQTYVKERQAINNHRIVQTITNFYEIHGSWSEELTDLIPQLGMLSGVGLKVVDPDGKVIAKSSSRITDMMMGDKAKQSGETVAIPIMAGLERVGDVYITPIGDFYGVPSEDLRFRRSINSLLLLGGMLAVIASLFISYIISTRMTSPLTTMTAAAKKIEAGEFSHRVIVKSRDEIGDLAAAFNHLAATLERQEKLRRDLTADIAHELRTPLASIRSHIEAYLDGVMQPSEKNIKSIHEEILRLTRLVADLGEIATLESGKVNIVKSKLDLNEIADKVVTNVLPLFDEKEVDLDLRMADKPLTVKGDSDKISQVLYNLLHNALKYTPAGGRAQVRLEKNGKKAMIFIKDTGIGIDLVEHPSIFERFYRVDKSRNRATGGAGIGLTVVKELVEAHNGNIVVASEPGKGTEFKIAIPLSA